MLDFIPFWNSWIAIQLFWLPMIICAIHYAGKAIQGVRRDLGERKKVRAGAPAAWYVPSTRVGTLVGYLITTICPVVNLFAAICYGCPNLLGTTFRRLERFFDIPLVPRG